METENFRGLGTFGKILKPVPAVVCYSVWQGHYSVELQVGDVGKDTAHTAGYTEVRGVLMEGLLRLWLPLKEETAPPKEVN